MNSVIEAATRPFRGPPRKVEPLSQWLNVDEWQLVELDRFRYHDWFTCSNPAAKDFELEMQPDLLNPEVDFIPNELIVKVVVDGKSRYRVLTRHERGTLARLKADVPMGPKVAPQAVIDTLIRYDLLTRTGAYWFRGCQTIIERLRLKGIEVHLTPDQLDVYATGAGGVAKDWALVDLVEKLTPLLHPFLLDGVPPACRVCGHKQPVESTTIAPGGVVWCGSQP